MIDYCWCGRPGAVRCDELALFVEAPEGFVLCLVHHLELCNELMDEHDSKLRQWAE